MTLCRQLSLQLPLDLILEVEEALVKVVDAHISVLTTTGVTLAGRVGSDCVEGAEVTTNTANLVFEDLVVKSSLELTLAGSGCGNIHGSLTTSEDNEILLGRNAGTVQWCVGGVRLQNLEVSNGDEVSGLVLGGSDEVGAVGSPLQIRDLHVQLVYGQVV